MADRVESVWGTGSAGKGEEPSSSVGVRPGALPSAGGAVGASSSVGARPGALPSAADIEEALREVVDPELGINIVDLGLVYGVVVATDGSVTVDMTLTSAGCPLTDVIEAQACAAVEGLATQVRINWVWMPPWGPGNITPEGREQLRALGFNV